MGKVNNQFVKKYCQKNTNVDEIIVSEIIDEYLVYTFKKREFSIVFKEKFILTINNKLVIMNQTSWLWFYFICVNIDLDGCLILDKELIGSLGDSKLRNDLARLKKDLCEIFNFRFFYKKKKDVIIVNGFHENDVEFNSREISRYLNALKCEFMNKTDSDNKKTCKEYKFKLQMLRHIQSSLSKRNTV